MKVAIIIISINIWLIISSSQKTSWLAPSPNQSEVIGTFSKDTDNLDYAGFQGFGLLKFKEFEKKLSNISGFEGFAPRITLITKLRNITNNLLNASSIFLIIVRY